MYKNTTLPTQSESSTKPNIVKKLDKILKNELINVECSLLTQLCTYLIKDIDKLTSNTSEIFTKLIELQNKLIYAIDEEQYNFASHILLLKQTIYLIKDIMDHSNKNTILSQSESITKLTALTQAVVIIVFGNISPQEATKLSENKLIEENYELLKQLCTHLIKDANKLIPNLSETLTKLVEQQKELSRQQYQFTKLQNKLLELQNKLTKQQNKLIEQQEELIKLYDNLNEIEGLGHCSSNQELDILLEQN